MADIDLGPMTPRARDPLDYLVVVKEGGPETAGLVWFAPEAGPSRFYAFHDLDSTGVGQDWLFSVSGTGAAHANQAPADGGFGWQRGSSGTTAAGRTGIFSTVFTMMRLGLGAARWRNRLRIPTLSTGTETYTLRSGFMDTNPGDGADGVFFRYTNGVNGGRFEAVTRNNSVQTAVDTGITVAAATTYILEIQVDAAGTSAEFRINGAVVATITTNIPIAAGRELGFGLQSVKSVGTTSVAMYDCDYVMAEQIFEGR